MKLNYIDPKLKRVYSKYTTLQKLKQSGKITTEQQEELIRLCKFLIDNLIQNSVALKKQSLMDAVALSNSK